MSTIVHFEIPVDDIERAKKFYTELFGWEIKEEPEMKYYMIKTSGENPVDGGMMKREHPQQQITNYIDVCCVDEYSKKIEKLGGKVVMPKTAVPGMGYFAVCLDTENNAFGIWETNKDAK